MMKGCQRHTSDDKKTIIYTRDGKFVARCFKDDKNELWFNAEGLLHRGGDLPAETLYENGKKVIKRWWHNGSQHRDGGLPAEIWYENGQEIKKLWYRDGKIVDPPKPAVNKAALVAEIEQEMASLAAKLAILKAAIAEE